MLRSIFRKKTNERFPAESFVVDQGERDGLPAFSMVDRGYKGYPFRREYPWHIEITIQIKDTNDAGLPSETEAEVLNALEDRIEAEMRKQSAIHHIARQTWNRIRMLDYYVEHGPVIRTILAAMRDGNPIRSFKYTIEHDDSWERCAAFF